MRTAPPNVSQALTPDFEAAHFRQALSRFATGVTVVTTLAAHAQKGDTQSSSFVGVTVSSFNSLSLSPPLVLWSMGLKSGNLPLFQVGTHYVINVLAADQLALCQRFAYEKGDRFADTDFTLGQAGLPILSGALAWFECHNRSRHEEGDHVIFVGEVERCSHRAEASPLLFHGGRFYTEHPL